MKICDNPFFWTTIIALIINFLLFLLNRKTFKLLYEKPWIQVRQYTIQEPANHQASNEDKPYTLIPVYIINPSSYNNLITAYKLRDFIFGTTIDQGDADISLPQYGRQYFNYTLDYEKTKKYENKFVVLTLTDLKRRKINKIFRLTDKNFAT